MQVQSLIPRPCGRKGKWSGYEAIMLQLETFWLPTSTSNFALVLYPSLFLSCTDSAQSLQKSGGLYLNFVRVGSAGEVVSRERHLLTGDITIVRVGTSHAVELPTMTLKWSSCVFSFCTGKKNYRLVKWKWNKVVNLLFICCVDQKRNLFTSNQDIETR